jgi:hypothetical protein
MLRQERVSDHFVFAVSFYMFEYNDAAPITGTGLIVPFIDLPGEGSVGGPDSC